MSTSVCRRCGAPFSRHSGRMYYCGDPCRFLSKVSIDGSGCWLWMDRLQPFGHGVFRVGDSKVLAHRFAFELLVAPIPKGLVLDHLCRVPRCVNPEHLEPVTSGENTLRGASFAAVNRRKTHCHRGHEFTPENTYTWRRQRHCRACRAVRNQGAA